MTVKQLQSLLANLPPDADLLVDGQGEFDDAEPLEQVLHSDPPGQFVLSCQNYRHPHWVRNRPELQERIVR